MKTYNVAILGATGAVGREMMKVLAERDFPVNKLCTDLFNGGGHLNAAGGEFHGTLTEAVARVEEAMPLYDRYLPQQPK